MWGNSVCCSRIKSIKLISSKWHKFNEQSSVSLQWNHFYRLIPSLVSLYTSHHLLIANSELSSECVEMVLFRIPLSFIHGNVLFWLPIYPQSRVCSWITCFACAKLYTVIGIHAIWFTCSLAFSSYLCEFVTYCISTTLLWTCGGSKFFVCLSSEKVAGTMVKVNEKNIIKYLKLRNEDGKAKMSINDLAK